jgi:hypothetical protein
MFAYLFYTLTPVLLLRIAGVNSDIIALPMINGTSGHAGGDLPAREASAPDLLDDIDKTMRLSARDLRLAASFDAQLHPLLERADELDKARRELKEILGGKALNHANSSEEG